MDLGFDRTPERRKQETKCGSEVHIVLGECDPSLDAAAGEIEIVAVPAAADAELFGDLFGNPLDSGARVFHAAVVGVVNVDIGHAASLPVAQQRRRPSPSLGEDRPRLPAEPVVEYQRS
jgi:hypothetical protein